MRTHPDIFFITGASGVGKSTLVLLLQKKHGNKTDWLFLHLDSIGMPSEEMMIEKFGFPENWQKVVTGIWIGRMLTDYPDRRVIIFEGQVNLDFIKEAFKEHNFLNYKIVLVDCTEETMIQRLKGERKQPDLATPDMNNWRRFLREQALNYGESIIDTGELDKEQTVAAFESILIGEGVVL